MHAQKIVHRDIKCGNVLLRADKHVMLSDFGSSKVFGETMARQLKVSRTFAGRKVSQTMFVMGTSGYMAPEVVRGANEGGGFRKKISTGQGDFP